MHRYRFANILSRGIASDNYTHGYHQAVTNSHSLRTVERYAHHVIPLLGAEKIVLDVGCGPGSITKGFAKYMENSGKLIALDIEESVLVLARENLKEVVGTEVEVLKGDVYELPFKDSTFDIVHAHQVLQHLSDPISALKEMKRVAKSYVCVRDVDYKSWNFFPAFEELDKWNDVYRSVCRANKANPDAGRYYKQWMYDAGFDLEGITLYGDVVLYEALERKREWGETWAVRTSETKLAKQAVDYGFATEEQIAKFAKAWREWAEAENSIMYYVDIYVTASL